MNYFFAGKPAVETSLRHRLTSPAENASFEYGIRPPADESKGRYTGRIVDDKFNTEDNPRYQFSKEYTVEK